MTPLSIILAIAVYIAILAVVAVLSGRKADNGTFFSGNRSQSLLLVTIAMISAAMSGVSYVSVPGMVAGQGFAYLQMCMGYVTGYVVIAFVLVPMYYRLNVVSIYEYLRERFGSISYRTGAWLFFVSKLLGAAVKILPVCVVLQYLVFDHYNIPFWANTSVIVVVIWLCTLRGGVRSVVWTDVIKTVLMFTSVALGIFFIARSLGLSFSGVCDAVSADGHARVFFFDDPASPHYFFKYFIAGMFITIAMTGLDQDMMQRTLSCRNASDAKRNMIVSGVLQTGVIAMFLVLGSLMYYYIDARSLACDSGDALLSVCLSSGLPQIVGIAFILGIVGATYGSAGSALTSLTTSFTVDILDGPNRWGEQRLGKVRRLVHTAMALLMIAVSLGVSAVGSDSLIDAMLTFASYTYGPILGLFAFGLATHRKVRERAVPVVAVVSPLLSFVLARFSPVLFNGYRFGYEILIINALIMFVGLILFSQKSTNFVVTKKS